MKKVQVAHLLVQLGVGGTEMMLYKILSQMGKDNCDHCVIVMVPGGDIYSLVEGLGVPIYSLKMHSGKPSFVAFIKLILLMKRLRPDVLCTWLASPNLAGALTVWLSGGRKLVWNIRNVTPPKEGVSLATRIASRACAVLSNYPNLILSNSEAGMNSHIASGYSARKWRVLPNGFDCDRFKPDIRSRRAVRDELGIPLDASVIGIVGRYTQLKDHLTFIRAATRFHTTRPETFFIMIGEGLDESNAALTSHDNLPWQHGRLKLLGKRPDVQRIYPAMDIFTLTSLGEGFPNVVGEAMSCGIPCVVTTTAGDAPKIVDDTGICVRPSDPDAIVSAWVKLLQQSSDDSLLRGERARMRIQRYYSVEAVALEYERLYLELAALP